MEQHPPRVPSLLGGTFGRWTVLAVSLWMAGCGGSSLSPTPPLTVYEVGNGVSTPTLVREVKPKYTQQALSARIQGTVVVTAVVLPDGTVGDVSVIRSLDTLYGLDAEAVSAAKQWLFNPGMKDGVAVAVRVTIEFTFTLK